LLDSEENRREESQVTHVDVNPTTVSTCHDLNASAFANRSERNVLCRTGSFRAVTFDEREKFKQRFARRPTRPTHSAELTGRHQARNDLVQPMSSRQQTVTRSKLLALIQHVGCSIGDYCIGSWDFTSVAVRGEALASMQESQRSDFVTSYNFHRLGNQS